ncbi:pyridoxal phosphate-dependent decarboxylase family protein [Vulcaniibacterium gelatinicum]|uniref:pyridoxal phosphate-dependent decarboxylase family protein n=1 Tax=Vulcaniibacterium gelatinicum TaxID=2598725 RepID=UPI0011CC8EF6|nr:pyridoxal-dependent decarboxylase [Vulcaniibacterium gelatinicum]
MSDPALYPCFLGPYGENDGLLEKLAVEFLRDHVYWRRNFHPEDPPAIPTHAAQHPEFLAFEARLRRELHSLSAALKRSVPFHSPRYLGHMVSDLALPGLAAQLLTLPYNPNNVSEDAAPVTIDLEIRAGLQLARMLGYCDDPARPECAFGHLTSGGTVANYQALRLALALKAFPVALRAAAPPGLALPEDDWAAFTLAPQAGIELLQRWQRWLEGLAPIARRGWLRRVENERIEQLGLVEFFARHPQLSPPVVLAPVTAHYSWSKGMKLLGLGREQLLQVPECGMRLDPAALADMLARLQAQRRPVLMAVAVLGTTEFGTIDPVHEVVACRDRCAEAGFGFSVHVDAAWGGYLATLFREPDGSLRPLEDMRGEFAHFPSAETHAAVAALGRSDSVTVDPHKLGYLPYGAGAFVCRDQRAMPLLVEEADYVFSGEDDGDYFARYRKLGRFILEGSKAGAAAAAVYVTHKVLPLDHAHFGRITGVTIHSTEAFMRRAAEFAVRMAGVLRVCVPFAPDSNLVCLALNPEGNRDVATMNAFMRRLHDALRCDPDKAVQAREFYGSMTTLRAEALGEADMARVLEALGLDPATLLPDHEGADRLVILRHTLMNPFLEDSENGISYIARYFDFLAGWARAALPATRSVSAAAAA